ncbi:MAG: hypothetical protein F2956_08215 [Actinobacteria bacterium]|nr:hypothetical protein [Actinomycetota bacterium]
MRNVRYGEVLAVFARDNKLEAEVYGTQMINDCPDELWKTLDAAAIASEMSALAVKLNGPRYWVLDGLGTKVAFVEPVMRDFNGLMMRRIATVDLGDKPATVPYEERYVNRGAVFFFDAGSVVYELINPQGKAYVMQAYCVGVDPTLNLDNLSDLANRLDLPTGWTFRSRILDAELVVDTTDHPATVVQDEFENTYTLPY